MLNSPIFITRPDTRLPQLRAGGQGPYLRSVEHWAGAVQPKPHERRKSSVTDRRTDGQTDGQTDAPTDKAGCRVS